jgi:hypothetical protein
VKEAQCMFTVVLTCAPKCDNVVTLVTREETWE